VSRVAERILVVEDEPTLRANIERALARGGHAVTGVASAGDARLALESLSFDVLLTDLRLPDGSGMELLGDCARLMPECVVIVMTAYASLEAAVEALRLGAHDFLLKPISLGELVRKIDHIAAHRRLVRENAQLRRMLQGSEGAYDLLRSGGRSMQALCALVDKAAASDCNVLIEGETGTGKELVARALHERSPRARGPLLTLDLRTVPREQVEVQLFGHARGAFPGAEHERDGSVRAASGGTLFLDEVGELDPSAQAKLLRVVETKEVMPLGEERGVIADVRIVASTQHDLEQRARDGLFRADLYHRLGVVRLRVPPLRERIEDIPELAERFLRRHAKAQSKPVVAIGDEAMRLLTHHAWLGNVRELSNALERAVMLCEGETLSELDLPLELAPALAFGPAGSSASEHASEPLSPEACNLENAVLAFQKQHLARVLRQTKGNREAAAKLLGLSSATFYRYLARANLKGFRPGAE
jgi:DNA-binding NtrC family response regulator